MCCGKYNILLLFALYDTRSLLTSTRLVYVSLYADQWLTSLGITTHSWTPTRVLSAIHGAYRYKRQHSSVWIVYHDSVLYQKPLQQQEFFRLAWWPEFYSAEQWTGSYLAVSGAVHRETEFSFPHFSLEIPGELIHENERNGNQKLIKCSRVLCCRVANWQSLKLCSELCYPVHHTVCFKGLKLVLCSARFYMSFMINAV